MSGLISKRPFVGFATSVLFGTLGLLLVRINPSPGLPHDRALWLFRVVGYFALFVALGSLVNAVHAVWAQRTKKHGK
jgi:hypothetical protein